MNLQDGHVRADNFVLHEAVLPAGECGVKRLEVWVVASFER
jgi:hypothetical protein